MDKTVKCDIKGQKYDVTFQRKEVPNLCDYTYYGETAYYDKKITVLDTKENIDVKGVLTHELVHAYLWESGLTVQSHDEVLVEWIARNIDKIIHTRDTLMKKRGKKK
jgi:predicted SprT family Zn-dependent metalloprotease